MANSLERKRVALLFTDGVEQAELEQPLKALREQGADTTLVSLQTGSVQMFQHMDPGDKIEAQVAVADTHANDFDALVLPGGVANPDNLRVDQDAVAFVRDFVEADKPIGVICHGPWTLVEAGVLKGRTITSWPSLKTDIVNAGAEWVDEEVHVDRNIISSRKPDDLPAFNSKLIESIGRVPVTH